MKSEFTDRVLDSKELTVMDRMVLVCALQYLKENADVEEVRKRFGTRVCEIVKEFPL